MILLAKLGSVRWPTIYLKTSQLRDAFERASSLLNHPEVILLVAAVGGSWRLDLMA